MASAHPDAPKQVGICLSVELMEILFEKWKLSQRINQSTHHPDSIVEGAT
jgi:hypothetical protein